MNFDEAYARYTEDYYDKEIPDTSSARNRLRKIILDAIRDKEDVLISAPTSLGKTYTVSTLPKTEDVGQIVHLSKIKKTRDEAWKNSKEAGLNTKRLRGITDVCAVADGQYDDEVASPDGRPASDWIKNMVEDRGVSSWKAHQRIGLHHRNERGERLPCVRNNECGRIANTNTKDAKEDADIIHATLNFVHSQELIKDSVVVFDERPSYHRLLRGRNSIDNESDMYESAIDNFLEDTDYNHHDLFTAVRDNNETTKEELRSIFESDIEDKEVLEPGASHVNVPEMGLAMLSAEEITDGRYRGEKDGVVVAFTEEKLLSICITPDLSAAESIICLDAHPKKHLWELSLGRELKFRQVFENGQERAKWRTQERGLCIVKTDENKRPLTTGWWDNENEQAKRLVEEVRSRFGEDFETVVTTLNVKSDLEQYLSEAGSDDSTVINYGMQKGRNDFSDEPVGVLIGCIELRDEYVEDTMLLCGSKAQIEDRNERPGDNFGREFSHPTLPEPIDEQEAEAIRSHSEDIEIALEIIESVREENVAQSAGRYARNPEEKDKRSIVYVWTDKIPDSMVDATVDGVGNKRESRKEIVEAIRDYEGDGKPRTQDILDMTSISRSTITENAEEMDCIRREGPSNLGYTYEYIENEDFRLRSVDLGLEE